MDMVTVIGLIAAGVMFTVGVAIVGFGLRRHAEPLPHGAEDVLDAVADGRLRPNGENYTDRGVVPTRLTNSMPLAEPPGDDSSIRLIPREKKPTEVPMPALAAVPAAATPAASSEPVIVLPPEPEPVPTAPAATPAAPAAAVPEPATPATPAPIPAVASSDDSFFAAPELQRF